MANPITVLKNSGVKAYKNKGMEDQICELISKAFTTRNLLHFAHWNTKSFASHMALGDLYDQIIEDIDEIVETYQGKYGLINDLYCEKANLPDNITQHVKDEAQWVEDNRMFISKGDTSIENLIDSLIGHYHKTVYKLENLH